MKTFQDWVMRAYGFEVMGPHGSSVRLWDQYAMAALASGCGAALAAKTADQLIDIRADRMATLKDEYDARKEGAR